MIPSLPQRGRQPKGCIPLTPVGNLVNLLRGNHNVRGYLIGGGGCVTKSPQECYDVIFLKHFCGAFFLVFHECAIKNNSRQRYVWSRWCSLCNTETMLVFLQAMNFFYRQWINPIRFLFHTCFLQFPFPQFIPADLTGDGLWECFGKLYGAGILIRGGQPFYLFLQVFCKSIGRFPAGF